MTWLTHLAVFLVGVLTGVFGLGLAVLIHHRRSLAPPDSRAPRIYPPHLLIMAVLFVSLTAALSSGADARQKMDWQDMAVAQEVLRMQGYRGLVVIGGTIDNDREPVELHVQAVPSKGKGLVVGIILKVEGGDLLQGVQE